MASDKSVIEAVLNIIDKATSSIKFIDAQLAETSKISNAISKKMQTDFLSTPKPIESSEIGINRVVSEGASDVKSMVEFDTAIAKMPTVADTSQVSVQELQKSLTALSIEAGIAVTAFVDAQYQAISVGTKTADSVGFVELAAKTAKIGFTDTTTAIDGLTSVLNAYGLEASQTTKIFNKMIITQNLGKTTFDEIASTMENVIPIVSSLCVSTNELFASVASLESMTGLKVILKPLSQVAEMAEKLEIGFSGVALESQDFARVLDKVATTVNSNKEVLSQLFSSVEALNAITVLTGVEAAKFTDTLGAMGRAAGVTESAFTKMMDIPAQAMEIVKTKIINVSINIGSAILSVIEKVIAQMTQFADCLLTVDLKTFANGVEKALNGVTAFINVLWDFRGIIIGIAAVALIYKDLMLEMAIATKIAAVNQGTLNTVLMAGATIFSPMSIDIIAIIGIVTPFAEGLYLLRKNWNLVSASMLVACEWFKKISSVIPDSLIVALKSACEWISNIDTVISNSLVVALKSACEWISNIDTVISNSLIVALKSACEWISNVAEIIWDVLIVAINAVSAPIERIINAFTGGEIIAGIKMIGVAIFDFVLTPITKMIELLSNIPKVSYITDAAFDENDNLRSLIAGSAEGVTVATTAPVTQRDSVTYSRDESVSRSEVIIGLEKGLTSKMSGNAPWISLQTVRSGAF